MDPRLDTGGWLALTEASYDTSSRQGLSPCKIRQAFPGAITGEVQYGPTYIVLRRRVNITAMIAGIIGGMLVINLFGFMEPEIHVWKAILLGSLAGLLFNIIVYRVIYSFLLKSRHK